MRPSSFHSALCNVSGALLMVTIVVGCTAPPAPTAPAEGRKSAQNITPPTHSVDTETGSSPESARCKPGMLPDFPWPVPAPSARMALPRSLLTKTADQKAPRLKDVANELDARLVDAGYSERAYFRLQREEQTVGFALVTRMERISQDGTPYPPEKRFLSAGAPDQFSVVDFLKSLFVAPVGYYRVIVFIVARTPVKVAADKVSEAGARQWLTAGGTRLLGCVANMPYTDEYGLDALIYEFRHAPEESEPSDKKVSQLAPSSLDPAIHLKRAGILDR
ncbi:MAG: hypothetical protein AAFV29_00125 [Myxococcota bacterium]